MLNNELLLMELYEVLILFFFFSFSMIHLFQYYYVFLNF